MRLASEALDFVLDAWRRRTVEVGPLVISTVRKQCEREINAYNIGCDVGALTSRPTSQRERHLRVVLDR